MAGYTSVIKGASDDDAGDDNNAYSYAQATRDAWEAEEAAKAKLKDRQSDKLTGSTTKGDEMKVTDEVTRLVGLIIACEQCPQGIKSEDFLNTLDEDALTEILAVHTEDSAAGDDKSASDTDGDDTTPDTIQVSAAEWQATKDAIATMRPSSDAWNESQRRAKDTLIASIDAASPNIAKSVYSDWKLSELQAYHADLSLDGVAVPDYSLIPQTSGHPARDRTVSGLAHLRKQANVQ